MKSFPKLHLWLILPFVITLLGFNGYWSGFTEASFQWHLHGLSATSWYIILIIQPWLYHNRPIQVHRKVGMIGLLLAGIVVASALSVVKGNLLTVDGPLFPIRYSLSFIDILTVMGFGTSVILSVLNAKNTQVHARWMISTVFWVLAPATVRLSFLPLGMFYQPKEFSDFPFLWTDVFIWNTVFIVALIAFLIIRDYLKEKKVYFSYILVGFVQLISIPMILELKDAEWLRDFLDAVFK